MFSPTANYTFLKCTHAWAGIAEGPNSVEAVATDLAGNETRRTYSVDVPAGATATFTHDADGNLLSDGTRSFTWDAESRLTGITHGDGSTSAFAYDGLGRRVRITERDAVGGVVSDRRYVWDGLAIAEERDAATNAVLKRHFPQGEQRVGGSDAGNFYYTRDHLRSVREVVDASGTVRARYDYSPWGERSKVSGDLESDFGFTGHFHHAPSGLVLAPYRAYDPELGRWLSRDPIEEDGGMNLYAYVANNPINGIDPLGLWNLWNPGTWGVPNVPGENPWNPVDSSAHWDAFGDSWADSAESISDSLGGMLTGNWDQLADSYGDNPLGQTECDPVAHNIVKGSLAVSGLAAAGAGTLIGLEAAGISSIGSANIGWKGGEIIFTRPGAPTPDWRINPFGGSGYPPHYHKRGPGGIGRHRPWQDGPGGWPGRF